jgi:hypothetical protein
MHMHHLNFLSLVALSFLALASLPGRVEASGCRLACVSNDPKCDDLLIMGRNHYVQVADGEVSNGFDRAKRNMAMKSWRLDDVMDPFITHEGRVSADGTMELHSSITDVGSTAFDIKKQTYAYNFVLQTASESRLYWLAGGDRCIGQANGYPTELFAQLARVHVVKKLG